jgi:carbamoyltransferase
MRRILGIRFGHDASAALVVDGKIVADVAEERLTRTKHDQSFPLNAIRYCLTEGGLESTDLCALAVASLRTPNAYRDFFQLPVVKTEARSESIVARLHKRILGYMDPPVEQSPSSMPLYLPPLALAESCQIVNVGHHLAHASSAYYTSGFYDEKALIATVDGIGDGVSVALWSGHGNQIRQIQEWDGSASLGWFYSAATEALGWRHGSGEWKMMGLAPYGQPTPGALAGFHPVFRDGELIRTHDFGTPGRYNDHGANHYHLDDAAALRKYVDELGREGFSAEVQRVFEEQMEQVLYPWLEREKTRLICCAGGAFLNVKMNQKLWYSGKVDEQWVYPNPGDSGLAVGAALHTYYSTRPDQPAERLRAPYFGPEFTDDEIQELLDERKVAYDRPADLIAEIAGHLADNRIVGWFQGRMEAGPRALGNRSILMSPLRAEHKDIINACVKYREAFRPFCPSLLAEKVDDYFVNGREEPYMITSFEVKPEKRDRIPAVVHVDHTARPQTVRRDDNPRYYDLIQKFGELTGEPILLNTSFNIRGEPIVCHPREAIRCFRVPSPRGHPLLLRYWHRDTRARGVPTEEAGILSGRYTMYTMIRAAPEVAAHCSPHQVA